MLDPLVAPPFSSSVKGLKRFGSLLAPPRMGDSFFRKERSKGRTKSTGADFAARPVTPEIGKMLPASKIPGGYSRPMPYGHPDFNGRRCDYASADPKRGIALCTSSDRFYVRRMTADPVAFFCERAGCGTARSRILSTRMHDCMKNGEAETSLPSDNELRHSSNIRILPTIQREVSGVAPRSGVEMFF